MTDPTPKPAAPKPAVPKPDARKPDAPKPDTPKPDASGRRRMRSAARLYAVQALFQMEAAGQGADQVAREFETHRFGAIYDDDEMAEGDTGLFRQILAEAVNWQAKIDQATDRALIAAWPIDRIDPVLRALFRAAGAELVATQTPPRVVITEFVEIAHAFFPDGREPKFVNAVLDHMARETRPEAF
ncbi:MAG: transcription antitermination factor NusB [Rhodobacteraceae bacterium]|nr:transcription antitermination factor NusB [Paracoccaceae bacterium]